MRERRRSIGLTVRSLVRHHNAPRTDVGTDVERRLELYAVAYLSAGQVEVERVAVEIGLEVDFGRETAARAAERLGMPPLLPRPPRRGRTLSCYRTTAPGVPSGCIPPATSTIASFLFFLHLFCFDLSESGNHLGFL